MTQAIQQNFEAVWESVRPVPVVRIDFGNGTVVTRTLHGNIATYVCTADGEVLDILPGIYTPNVYLDRLNQLRLLANYVQARAPETRPAFVRQYHERAAAAVPEDARKLDRTKDDVIEKPVANAVAKGTPAPREPAPVAAAKKLDMTKKIAFENRLEARVASGGRPTPGKDEPALTRPEDLAGWKLLVEDTQLNESIRRRQIHQLLAGTGLVRPEIVTRRIYKDILHADLDDPYLGLGPALFGSYPFSGEEKAN